MQSVAYKPYHLIMLSAKNDSALESATDNLAKYLAETKDNLSDIAYTLQTARQSYEYRRFTVGEDPDLISIQLQTRTSKSVFTARLADNDRRSVTFMFPGQGSQHINMALELYKYEPKFRENMNKCSEAFSQYLGLSLTDYLYPSNEQNDTASDLINNVSIAQTKLAQPALFSVGYSLAQLLISYGILPESMIGPSLGEYIAACISKVFGFEDAIKIVAERGKLMQELPVGVMYSVPLNAKVLKDIIAPFSASCSIAAINASNFCVISGDEENIKEILQKLNKLGIESKKLITSHAFHSPLMEAMLPDFREVLENIKLNSPTIPFISNLTGKWISDKEATSPQYWLNHLRNTVCFSAGLDTLLLDPRRILLEVGAGQVLCSLAGLHSPENKERIVPCGRKLSTNISELLHFNQALGQLWLRGCQPNISNTNIENRLKIRLPTYPFDRKKYWVPAQLQPIDKNYNPTFEHKKNTFNEWFYIPLWEQSPLVKSKAITKSLKERWIIFSDKEGIGQEIDKILLKDNIKSIQILSGDKFEKISPRSYSIRCSNPDDYNKVFTDLKKADSDFYHIIYLWNLNKSREDLAAQSDGFYNLLNIVKSISQNQSNVDCEVINITNNFHLIRGDEADNAGYATSIALLKVIGQEMPNFKTASIDIDLYNSDEKDAANQILEEILTNLNDKVLAYRNNLRWVQKFKNISLPKANDSSYFKENGTYLITGGLGEFGLEFAKYLAEKMKVKLILVSRSKFPPKNKWSQWCQKNKDDFLIGKKIEKLQYIQSLGTEIDICQADVASINDIQKIKQLIIKEGGKVNGVIHAAGVINAKFFSYITHISRSQCEEHFRSKILGVINMKNELEEFISDFCILLSSISSQLGGLGFSAYSAANLFMDNFALKSHFEKRIKWLSINMEGLKHEKHEEKLKESNFSEEDYAITYNEAAKLIDWLSNYSDLKNIIISSGNLEYRLNKWIIPHEKADHSALLIASQTSWSERRSSLSTSYRAPEKELEKALCELWEDLFSIKPIGVEDNFFELGGDSLLALQLNAKIRNKFKFAPNLHDFFETPTIKGIAEKIEALIFKNNNGTSSEKIMLSIPSSVLPIQPSGKHSPIFFIHPSAGLAVPYQGLAKYLKDTPIYGISCPYFGQEKGYFESIEDMAKNYINLIRKIQHKGPYRIGGWSFGGIVAYEMAQQLKSLKEEVELLLLIDSYNRNAFSSVVKDDNIDFNLFDMEKPDFKTQDFQAMSLEMEKSFKILSLYLPQSYEGNIVILKAKDRYPTFSEVPHNDIYNGWGKLINLDKVTLHFVDGYHFKLFDKKYIKGVARKIASALKIIE